MNTIGYNKRKGKDFASHTLSVTAPTRRRNLRNDIKDLHDSSRIIFIHKKRGTPYSKIPLFLIRPKEHRISSIKDSYNLCTTDSLFCSVIGHKIYQKGRFVHAIFKLNKHKEGKSL